jgi:hypothetical protein
MTTEELYFLLNSSTAASGPSEAGMSVLATGALCGLRGALAMAVGYLPPAPFPAQFLNGKGKPRGIGARAGVAFHALQELWFHGAVSPTDLKPLQAALVEADASLAASAAAFVRSCTEMSGDIHHFGTVTAREFPVRGIISGVERTGRIDAVLHVEDRHLPAWIDRGCFDIRPGLYLWDDKLVSSATAAAVASYQLELQASAYLALYEQTTSVQPDGFIHALTSRAVKPEFTKVFGVMYNTHALRHILEDGVRLAMTMTDRAKANSFACKVGFSACPYTTLCPRYGSLVDHPGLIDSIKERFSLTAADADSEE